MGPNIGSFVVLCPMSGNTVMIVNDVKIVATGGRTNEYQ